jgi:hypothetical protein
MSEIEIIRQAVNRDSVTKFLGHPFEDMVKFVADIERGILALGGELHSDAEAILLKDGSIRKNLWGGNLYPLLISDRQLEYTSLINIRPSQGNRSLEVQDESIRAKIRSILALLTGLPW